MPGRSGNNQDKHDGTCKLYLSLIYPVIFIYKFILNIFYFYLRKCSLTGIVSLNERK